MTHPEEDRPRNLAPLEASLRARPSAFDFFQAVRVLERVRPRMAPVGRFGDPGSEVVRFTVNPSLAFPPAEIHDLQLPDDGQAVMSINFMGLTGSQGVLPHCYSLLVMDRLRRRDDALQAFLDIFHHRLISLFYRAWQRARTSAAYERAGADRLAHHILELVGLGKDPGDGEPDEIERRMAFYAGLLGPQARGAVALEQLIEDVLGVPAEVEQFVGGAYPLSVQDQCAVGGDQDISNALGLGAVAGDEIWDQQTRVRIRLGPLHRAQYDDFLPGGAAHGLLGRLVRFFSRDAFDFEAQLILTREDVEACVLGEEDGAPQLLGWATWLRVAEMQRDPDETILRL